MHIVIITSTWLYVNDAKKLMENWMFAVSFERNVENWVNMSRDDRTEMKASTIPFSNFVLFIPTNYTKYIYCILCFGASNYSSGCNGAVRWLQTIHIYLHNEPTQL